MVEVLVEAEVGLESVEDDSTGSEDTGQVEVITGMGVV